MPRKAVYVLLESIALKPSANPGLWHRDSRIPALIRNGIQVHLAPTFNP